MMKVKCKTPFAKQAVICRATNTPRKTKQRKFIDAQRQTIHRFKAALKKKKPTRQGKRQRTLQEVLTRFNKVLLNFELPVSAQF